jgi:hypothetical protein
MLKERLVADMKAAMKAGDKERLGVIRLINAAIKQREVDDRVALDDAGVLAVLDKMLKQRRDSIEQYTEAGREDLAAALSDDEIGALIDEAITDTGAAGMRDMGKVMGLLKPKLQGRADIAAVSQQVKGRLSA